MIVIDASVLAPALSDDGPSGDRARARLTNEALSAPELIDLEVASVLRGRTNANKLPGRRAALAMHDLTELPLERVPHRPLLARCWQLRANLTIYDAAYVALAELLDARLVTADARLGRVPGVTCTVEVVTA